MHPAALDEEQLKSESDVTRTRRGGPGGQHRNKVETAVVVTHRATGVAAEANERRSQADNLREALFRLRIRLALAIRTTPESSPSDAWNRHLRGGRVQVNAHHDDFPTLLAEVLDGLAAADGNLPEVAETLGTSSSQLVKFLKLEPAAFRMINEQRQARGLHLLK